MGDRGRVLLVDDEPQVRELLERHLRNQGYDCGQAENGLEALERIDEDPPDLVVTDIKMPRMDGMELLRRLTGRGLDLPVVVITSMADVKMAVSALSMGAAEYLMKPFNLQEVTIAVERALEHNRLRRENRQYQLNLERMVREKTRDLLSKNRKIEEQARSLQQALSDVRGAVHSLVAAVEAWDGEVSKHNVRVQDYAVKLGQTMNLSPSELHDLSWGALFHDVGKIAVPAEIICKPGRLTAEEWEKMKIHPIKGYRIISSIPSLRGAAKVVLYHHERFDGHGYLAGRKGEEIPLGARIFSVVDTFDAMTSARPYKKPSSFEVAFEEIKNCAGTQFDPEVVETFLGIPVAELDKIRAHHEDSQLQTKTIAPSQIEEALRRVEATRGA
jgi:response regulator RpfG family c-di-GMP phosphodiesterase